MLFRSPVGPALTARLLGGTGAPDTRPVMPAAASLAVVATCVVLFAASVLLSAAGTYSPFIYFRF